MKTFSQIINVCEGFLQMNSNIKLGLNLIKAKINIKYNYSDLLSTCIRITNDLGDNFTIQTISHTQGKWLIKINLRKHGTFKSQAATNFDEFNPNAEQFTFIGSEALPSKHPTSDKNLVINSDMIEVLIASNNEDISPVSQEISNSCPFERSRSWQD